LARKGWVSPGPLEDACPLCDNPLGAHHPTRNPLTKWRKRWAHKLCVLREKGE
jgi:hypothetical protein